MNAPHLPNTDHRESSDRYHGEVLRRGAWRVVICRDGIQAIVQYRARAGAPDRARWEGRRYCTTRAALIRDWRALTDDDGAALAALIPATIRTKSAGV